MGQPHELDSYQLLDALSAGKLNDGLPNGNAGADTPPPASEGPRRRQTYPEFFGFREKPFDLTPNPDYLYLPHRHKEMLAALLMGLEEGKGFLKLTGEPGTGKTTLCRSFLKNLKGHYRFACINIPAVDGIELLQSLNQQFGLPAESTRKKELIHDLSRFLLAEHRAGRRTAVLIDEAQNLDAAVWEEIRLLSNLETETEKLIQFILIGQPALDRCLNKNEWRPVRQRIALQRTWTAFNRDETRGYIHYRLQHAGGKGKVLIDGRAFDCIYRTSQGVPRMINALMDRALTIAHRERIKKISAKLIRQAADDLGGLELAPSFLQKCFKALLGLILLALVGATGLFFAVRDQVDWQPAWGIDLDPVIQHNLFSPRPAGKLVTAPPQPATLQPAASLPVRTSSGAYRIVHPGHLHGYFSTLTGEESEAYAQRWLLKTWGAAPDTIAALKEIGWQTLQTEHALHTLSLNANLERLTMLNHPALITLDLGGTTGRHRVTYLGRIGNVGLFGSKDLLQIPLGLIDPVWDRKAELLWKNFEGLPETMRRNDEGETVLWLQRQLHTLGFFDGLEAPLYGPQTEQAVKRFQQAHRLETTGRLDPETQLLLYNQLTTYPTPRLAKGE
ncbi:ExeA family protein [Nitrospina watsonii]|uniref:General secretion pathway protein-related protein n=1 Tax=Nitrospina watsonii TaxID=1323948 RepID=A0ABM9HGU1_9BACT|nr:ExeA family protein [Nitrospina watsonii]CAI2719575.1 Putative General secretion pathway protein-related protein [Nitrospina watsonii]